MVPYPSDFPTAALTMILDKLRGQSVPVSDLVHGAWNVAGYALSQALPTESAPVVGAPVFATDADLVEYAIAEGAPADGVVRGVIPWLLILRLALRLMADPAP